MDIVQAMALGTIQGLTEFFPISSSGHLIFLPKLFGWADQGLAFDVVVHLGTLVAVAVYFRKKLMMLVSRLYADDQTAQAGADRADKKFIWFVFLSVIPATLAGFFFGDWIGLYTRSAAVVAWSMIGWGIVLAAADGFNRRLAKHGVTKPIGELTSKNVFLMACAQAVALIPGTSRAGITMTAGLFSRLDKKSAVEFSFFMALPVIALAGATKLIEFGVDGVSQSGYMPLIAGFLSATVSGLGAIWGVMKIITRWSFLPFVVYRVVVGVLIIVYIT